MKKTLTYLLAVALIAASFVLPGCSAGNDGALGRGTAALPQAPDQAPANNDESQSRGMRYSCYWRGLSGSQEHYYYSVPGKNPQKIDHTLHIANLTTGESGILCKEDGCAHADDLCQAYIDSTQNGHFFMVPTNGKLYIVYLGGNNVSDETLAAKIEERDLDGSNARTLYTFADGETIFGTNHNEHAFDDENIYFFYNQGVEAGQALGEARWLAKFNVNEAAITNLMEVDYTYELFGAYDGTLVINKWTEPSPEAYADMPSAIAPGELLEYEIFTVSVENGSIRQLEYQYSGRDAFLHKTDGNLCYILERDTGDLSALNLDSGEMDTLIPALLSPEHISQYATIAEIRDNYLLMASGDNSIEHLYSVNLLTKETNAFGLTVEMPEIGGYQQPDGPPVRVLAGNGHNYFVIAGYNNDDVGSVRYALISIEDYWGSSANYIPIN